MFSIGIGSDSDDETSIADLKAMRKCVIISYLLWFID